MYRVRRSLADTEQLVKQTFQSVGVRYEGTDEHNRLRGVASRLNLDAELLVDIAQSETDQSVCYVAVFGRYMSRPPVHDMLGNHRPKATPEFEAQFRDLGGDDVEEV